MKLEDIAEWSARWSTPLGTMDANAPVAEGMLVVLSFMGNVHHRSRGAMPRWKTFRLHQSAGAGIRSCP
jgi:hypothetical protein